MEKRQIVIEVEGGVVTAAYSTDASIDLRVIDLDVMKDMDPQTETEEIVEKQAALDVARTWFNLW